MKNKYKIVGILIVLVILITILIPGKSIAGYSYLPSINQRLEIIPPSYMGDELEPIVIEDKQEIKRFINSIKTSKIDNSGNGTELFLAFRDNDKPYLAIGLSTDFPERIIGWEYLNEGEQAYLYPTLFNEDGESYIPSPELIQWMDEQMEKHWPELEK